MATLGTIRKRSGLLIIVIGIAMLSFLLTDALRSGNSLFQSGQNTVASINGKDIGYQSFNRMVQNTAESYKRNNQQLPQLQIVNMVWEQLTSSMIIENEINKMGLKLGKEDLWKAIISSPNIINHEGFKGANGIFDETKLKEYLAIIKNGQDPQAVKSWNLWLNLEESLKGNALNVSYLNLLKSGVRVTDFDAIQSNKEKEESVDIDYVYAPYSSIKDTEITVSDEEIQDYINSNKEDFKKEESRDIQYIHFPITPSLEDETETLEDIKGIAKEFKTANNIKEFVNENSDVIFYDGYSFKDKYRNDFEENFAKTSKIGDFSKIYKDGDTYNISKIMDIRMLPDSVKASHILITYKGSQGSENSIRTQVQAKELADSIYNVLQKKNNNFKKLAEKFSDGPTKIKGGELGWFTYGTMVKNFNDFCFLNSKKLGVVKTNFGYHIIKISKRKNKQKAVKVATITRNIVASETTENEIYTKVISFVNKNKNVESFTANAKLDGLDVKFTEGLSPLDFNIIGIGDQRQIVRWAFDDKTKFEDVKFFNIDGGYAVAIVSGVYTAGLSSIDDVRSEITEKLKQEKKAKILKSKFISSDLKIVASKLNEQVKSVNRVSFNTATISGVGVEPKVIGIAFGLNENDTSKAIIGENGVFMIKVKNKNKAIVTNKNYKVIAQQMEQMINFQVNSKIIQALKNSADIEDNRAKFY